MKHIDDALRADQDSGKFRYQKATIYMEMSEHDKAIAIFDELIALNEWNPEVLANRAESHMATKQYSNAKSDYEKLQSLTPNDPRMYLRFAQIAEAENVPDEELKNYNLFLKYVDQSSISTTELEQIQNRVEKLQGAKP
jgi:tetratricopeptide (TPR) repeat protein